MPTFRARQQENLVLRSFKFDGHMYPMLEIIKEYDRKRDSDKQSPFHEIYLDLIETIQSERVFVDLPLYLKERASMKNEVIAFSRSVIASKERRTKYLQSLGEASPKMIPVISSYLHKTGEIDTLQWQEAHLRPNFPSIAFRVMYNQFNEDWPIINQLATAVDFIILDLDNIAPYPSPSVRQIMNAWRSFSTCPKIILRSAINTDIQNVGLDHGEVVFDIDNGLIDTYKQPLLGQCFGDYAGIKKDDLTSGGAISPGFLFYDAVDNQFVGFKGSVKELSEFKDTIVPAVINSEAAKRMQASGLPYLDDRNWGWQTLLRIQHEGETGKSQAKFKRIAMEHYLHCIRVKIEAGELKTS
ncbi:hypothetical protein QT327_19000 [Olivibacter sp. 47]|uniref:beta family protein n=1 Tax=Olivibacter sp. 47 TaxID=3056486 RepID=UPI0025A45BF6|nr:hypothetical protein [Olivibacter sp. 47]MDM8176404.1 hypothetical protein [Olivibacter sp. 47]